MAPLIGSLTYLQLNSSTYFEAELSGPTAINGLKISLCQGVIEIHKFVW